MNVPIPAETETGDRFFLVAECSRIPFRQTRTETQAPMTALRRAITPCLRTD